MARARGIELFGVEFIGGDHRRLLLNPEFEGTPLRKDEVLAARTGMNWPGAKEPGRPRPRQAVVGWCRQGSRILRCGVIVMRRSRRLTRRRWPNPRSEAGSDGGVRELARVLASVDPVDRTGLYVLHDLCPGVPHLVHQH